MNININYYALLGVKNDSNENEIKKAYYGLAMKEHPDRGGDALAFAELTEAYDVLCSKERANYDLKSKFGNSYNEYFELFNINSELEYDDVKSKKEKFRDSEVLNIQIKVGDDFDGSVEYERYVKCKSCAGSGKDLSSKIVIRDVDGNILRTFDADDGCDFCFEEDNNVITKRGSVKISDIKLGDMVLSKGDEYYEVINLMKREYSGELYDMNVSGIRINGVTPNHKFNIVRFKRNKNGRIKINNYDILEISADELNTDDFILYQSQTWVPNEYVVAPTTLSKIKKLDKILIDDDFVRFISCYIAEGNTRGDRVTVLTFHVDKDSDLIEFVKNYVCIKLKLNIKCFMEPEFWGDKVLKIEIFNSQLSKLLKEYCGHTSLNKFINNDILGKCDQLLLDTLILCDGYKKDKIRTYTTVSEKLAYQVLHLALGLGHTASVSLYDKYIDKNGVNHKSCYRVYITYFGDSVKMSRNRKLIKEGICLKIRDVKIRDVISTEVYNITVSETHKYTIDGLLVNNCEGSGKDYRGESCSFCSGHGKVGMTPCNMCKGDKRILGKQKLSGIKLDGDEKKVDSMGHHSKSEPGKSGYLLIVRNKSEIG